MSLGYLGGWCRGRCGVICLLLWRVWTGLLVTVRLLRLLSNSVLLFVGAGVTLLGVMVLADKILECSYYRRHCGWDES